MAKIVFFCIPAHGHTNPTLPVVQALTAAGHEVIYYSYASFRGEIEAAGARFMPCDDTGAGPAAADGAAVARDITVAAELISQVTLAMDAEVTRQLEALRPDVIVSDSVAFWGKLFARKLGIPYVCSCTTFAFNQYSSRIMKQSFGDLLRMLVKLPRTGRLLKPLRDRGYPAKNIMSIIQNDNDTPTVVYTSPEFQPCADTFSDRYTFVGPCIRPAEAKPEKPERPLVYISMGTVIQREADFYRRCAEAFSDGQYEVVISAGTEADVAALGPLPENIRAYPRVDQIAVLQIADVFITHCGMNSVSEALWFSVPLVTRPLTPEESGVANRVIELGAGLPLEAADAPAIRAAVDRARTEPGFRSAAAEISAGFRRCGGPQAAARAILATADRR